MLSVWVQADGGVKVFQIGMELLERGRRAPRARTVKGSTRGKKKARTRTPLQLHELTVTTLQNH